MAFNLSSPKLNDTLSMDTLQLNITKAGNINTSGIKQEHNSDPQRLENLKKILNNEKIKENLRKRGISYDMSGNLIFSIQHSEREKTEFEIQNIGDFYGMLKRYEDLFLPDEGSAPFYGDVYEIDENDSRESNLFAAFLLEYTEKKGDLSSEFEIEREKINRYREERLDAINDTLSHSGQFISGKNKLALGETPFYDMLTNEPKLKKKCIKLANKCADNPLFTKFIDVHVVSGKHELAFFKFLEDFNDNNLDLLTTLFRNDNFVFLMENIFKQLPGTNNTLVKIKTLIQDENIEGNIINLFYQLNKKGARNIVNFLLYAGLNWEKYFENISPVFIERINGENNFGKEFSFILEKIAILPKSIVDRILQNLNTKLIMDIYAYIKTDGINASDFITKLGYIFEQTILNQHIVWLEKNYEGITINEKLRIIDARHIFAVEKLNEGINPILYKKGFLGYPLYKAI